MNPIVSKKWTINLTVIVESKNDLGIPPTMAELENLFDKHGFEVASPRDIHGIWLLMEKK